ncbi:MAG TPA: hypothetical protein VNV85_10045 [Puia sp.]|nr:hypothetical protein [Puia sp.]
MSTDAIKREINKALDQLSDKELQDLLSFIKNKEKEQTISLLSKTSVEKILTEDQILLQKLAQ